MTKDTPSNVTTKKVKQPKRVIDQDLWEQHRGSILPLKEKYRHVILPTQERSIMHPHMQDVRKREFLENHKLNYPSVSQTGNWDTIRKQVRVKKVCIDARLDLHGLTLAAAHQELLRFIFQAQLRENEWILIITGKGDDKKPETLRKLVPQWLDQIPQVSGYAPAKPKDGGNGAYYVRIRRNR